MINPGQEKMMLLEKVLLLKSLKLFKETPETILAELAPIMEEVEIERGVEITAGNK